jgi:hypothetical protein
MSSSYVEVLVDVLQPRLAGASPAAFTAHDTPERRM